jgi:hypothetical protein
MIDEEAIEARVLRHVWSLEEALKAPVKRDFLQSCNEMASMQATIEAHSVPDKWSRLEDKDQFNEDVGLS